MWCAKCQADVSTDISADGQSINCTSCGSEIRKTQAPSLHPEIRRARQLIEQLSTGDAESQADEPKSDLMSGESKTMERDEVREPARARSFRVDAAHASEGGAHSPPPKITVAAGGAEPDKPHRRQDDGHPTLAAPHFDLTEVPQKRNPGKAESIWGQLLAYGGVAVLTVGTALVLWGYFGGPPQYAPTGWLVATAGQMLLFLGVVTLISGGMQQTTHEVTARVEYIGNRMVRFEQAAEQVLRGPHFGRDEQPTKEKTGHGDDETAAS